MMKDHSSKCPIGVCVPASALSSPLPDSVDFIELCAMDALYLESQQNFDLSISILAIRCLLPERLLVATLPDTITQFDDYLSSTARAFSTLGVKRLVLGSGASRNIPEGHDRTSFDKKWKMFASLSAKHWTASGLEVLLEPLIPAETNFINTIPHAERWVPFFNGIVADIEHVRDDPALSTLAKKKPDLIRHVHLSGISRRCPTDEDWPRIEAFLFTMLDAGARPSISFEIPWDKLAPHVDHCIDRVRFIVEKLT